MLTNCFHFPEQIEPQSFAERRPANDATEGRPADEKTLSDIDLTCRLTHRAECRRETVIIDHS